MRSGERQAIVPGGQAVIEGASLPFGIHGVGSEDFHVG
jgi:hypothetical protein